MFKCEERARRQIRKRERGGGGSRRAREIRERERGGGGN